jgi:hypothetical protein
VQAEEGRNALEAQYRMRDWGGKIILACRVLHMRVVRRFILLELASVGLGAWLGGYGF